MRELANLHEDVGEILLTEEEIAAKVRELGARIKLNRVEPYFTFAAGYAKLKGDGLADIQDLDIHGFNGRAGFGLDGGAGLGLSVDARREAVGALAFSHAVDRDGANDAVVTAIQRNTPGAVDIAVDIAIGVDPEAQHAPMHATDLFVDGGKALRDIALDHGRQRRQAEFECRRCPRRRCQR